MTNLVVAVVATLVLDAMGVGRGVDETKPDDYFSERA